MSEDFYVFDRIEKLQQQLTAQDAEIAELKRQLEESNMRVKVLERASSLSPQSMAEVYIRNEQRLAKRINELEIQLEEALARYDLENEAYNDLFRQLSEAEKREIDLNAELAEARKDTERLEFLISCFNEMEVYCEFVNTWHPTKETSQRRATDTQWREDIDAARKKPYCPACNSAGISHCSDPEHCGEVVYPAARE